MLTEIVLVFQAWSKANYFIRNSRSWGGIIASGLIYAALFIAGIILFWNSADFVVSWINKQLGIQQWLQKSRSEWLSFLFVMSGIMFKLVLLLFYFSFFKYFILIAGSPVFAYLSEKTEGAITNGELVRSQNKSLLKKSLRSIKLDLRNCFWQTFYLIALVLLSLVPIVGWIAPAIGLLLECYYFGFSMLDFSLERHKYSPQESIKFISHRKGLAIANGFIFYFMHFVIILAPVVAIVTATFTIQSLKNK